MKVLIADDDIGVLEYLKTLFEELGHEVMVTEKSDDVVKKAILEQPDLVLLDIVLPGKDGLTLLKEIKEFDKDIAVVMITAYHEAARAIDSFRLGAMDCLLKPFNVDYIKDSILPRVMVRNR
jgi:DNA-binding NtrC family response regulator